jgi:tRNA pseudouridine55 synthase
VVGVVLVDKPVGPTSHDVVRIVRRATGADAAGHTGTLDPFATGLMVVLLGRATRIAQFVEGDRKTYRATAMLGQETTTEDATGEPIGVRRDPADVTVATIEAALGALRGPILQRPPAFSAKKVAGKRAYAMARQGVSVELAAVPVTVHAFEILSWQAPLLEFRCTVSAGTYVRSLARDLGEALGYGAHLTALRREAIGALHVNDATPLEAVDASTTVQPPTSVLGHLPCVLVPAVRVSGLRHGQALPPQDDVRGTVQLLREDGTLMAVGEADDRRIHPAVVLEAAE